MATVLVILIFGSVTATVAFALLSLAERTGWLPDFRDDLDDCRCPAHRAVR